MTTAPAITSLAISQDYDLFLSDNGAGNTVTLAYNHEVVSNLAEVRVRQDVPWKLFYDNPDVDSTIIEQRVRVALRSTYGVLDVDMTGFGVSRSGRSTHFGDICFTVDCANSKEVMTF